MSGGNSIINLGKLSKPATVLIERISDAVEGYAKPYQIRRVAQAQADAEKIKAIANIEITELEQRALQRLLAEESKKQNNMDSVTAKALPALKPDSKPQDVEEDWITNFFDKCRLISDDQMQSLWAKVLAGEANSPGSFSKRTVNFLDSLDKKDAALFTKLCGFGWFLGDVVPLVYDHQSSIYKDQGITYSSLKHLDNIGLISFGDVSGFKRMGFGKRVRLFYYGTPIDIEFRKESGNDLAAGQVLLSRVGQELAPICGSVPVDNFLDFVLQEWLKLGLVASSPFPRQKLS